MHKIWRISNNPYFMLPMLLWVVTGALLLINFSQRDLFFAINAHYNDFWNVAMYYITWLGQAEVVIPTLIILMMLRPFRTLWFFLTALLCNVVPFLIQHPVKGWLNWPRPRLVFHDVGVHWCDNWPKLLHSSFPSGHTQGAFSFFCFLSLILMRKHRAWGAFFFVLAMAVGYSRIYLAAHFFEDVYVGSMVGVVITTTLYTVMEHYKKYFFRHPKTLV